MFLVHQYDENGHIGVIAQATTHEEAQQSCRNAEAAWSGPYGAAYYSRHGIIQGDREGRRDQEQLPAWDRHGSVMTGREHE